MTCLSREQLVDYLFNRDGSARASMETHVAACPKCRGKIESLKRLKAAAASAPLPPVSPDFTAKLMRGLPAEAPRKAHPRAFYEHLFKPAWAFGLAACALVLYFGVSALKEPGAPRAVSTEVLYFSDGPATAKKWLAAPARPAAREPGVYSYTDNCATARCGML